MERQTTWVVQVGPPEGGEIYSVLRQGESAAAVCAPFDDLDFRVLACRPVSAVVLQDVWHEGGDFRCLWNPYPSAAPTRKPATLHAEDLAMVLFGAVRYALGRRTYYVGWVTRFVRMMAAHLPDNDLAIILRDIQEQGRRGERFLGDPCDQVNWSDLAVWLAEQLDLRSAPPVYVHYVKERA